MGKANYSTANTSAWRDVADKLFMAQFQGKPCEICGETEVRWGDRIVRTMGHHLLDKHSHNTLRYDPNNIIILCAEHHLGEKMSPHARNTFAVFWFYDRLGNDHKDYMYSHGGLRPIRYTYRDAFLAMGGTVDQEKKKKDWRPTNLAEDVRRIKRENLRIGYLPNEN